MYYTRNRLNLNHFWYYFSNIYLRLWFYTAALRVMGMP